MAIDAIHGDTNSGKTKSLERLAGHIYETSGKKTRVYIGDGGGDTYNDRGLVDDDIIQMMDFSVRPYPLTVMKLMTDFWFLSDPQDPNSKLVKPDRAKFYEEYGLVIFEGGSVMGNWALSDIEGGLAWHGATGTGFGGVKDEEDELSYTDAFKGADGNIDAYKVQGTNAIKHFMIVQRKLLQAIRTSKKFPGLTYWTFHSTEGADRTAGGTTGDYGKIQGKKIIGPDVGGKALASTIGREFGNLLHADQATSTKKELDETTKKQVTVTEREFRLYTRRHMDPNQDVAVEYIAGTRMSGVQDYYTSKTPGDSILQFYADVTKLRKAQKDGRGVTQASK